jgi:hypothetical protein
MKKYLLLFATGIALLVLIPEGARWLNGGPLMPAAAQAPGGFNPNCTFSGNNNNNNCNQYNGTQPRSLNREDGLKKQILSDLPRDKPIIVVAIMGDSESLSFASEIYSFLKDSGFKMARDIVAQAAYVQPVKGLIVEDAGENRRFIVGANLP